MLPDQSFGAWLKRHRKALDLTQAALADRVGCSAAAIRKFEAEERVPSAQIAGRLAEIFEIPAGERAAFQKFARGDRRMSLKEPAHTAPWQPSNPALRSNVPLPVTSLIGRASTLEVLRSYLANPEIRLITLIGAPGIGKTRLALELVRSAMYEFLDGAYWVALASLEDPALIVPTIFQTLGYVEPKNAFLTPQLLAGIGDKQILLVLDNCEHLIDTVVSLVVELLSACPRLKLVLTSREALRVPGEWRYTLTPLEFPKEGTIFDADSFRQYSALELFAERARAVRSDFTLNQENFQAIASICTQLDGLPLAIELIAARIRLMSPLALVERLTSQFVLSADGMRAINPRQKTLENAIQWSYHLLSPEEQFLLSGCSVFSGGFTLEAVEASFSPFFPSKSIPEMVALLFDKSLLERTFTEDSAIRFTMLAPIQQFAAAHLRSSGIEADLRDAHLAYFLDFAETGEHEMRGPQQAVWGDRLERELDNFRAALEWCLSASKVEPALCLLKALGWLWEVRGHYCELRGWFERFRYLPATAQFPLIFAQVLNHIGRQSWTQEDYSDAHAFLGQSQEIVRSLGEAGEPIQAETLNWLGLVTLLYDRDLRVAQTMFEHSLELYCKGGNQHGVALVTFHLGILHAEQNDEAQAFALLEDSLSRFRQYGDLFFIARVSIFLGFAFLKKEQTDQARLLFIQQLEIDQQIKFWDGIADGWLNLGHLHYHQEQYEEARLCFEQSVQVCHQHGLKKYDAYWISGLLALRLGNMPQAFQYFTHQIGTLRWSDEKAGVARLFLGLAAVAASASQPERAARLVGAAQSFQENLNLLLPANDQPLVDRPIQSARQALGAHRFDRLVAEGRAMTPDQAIAFSLK